MTETPVKEQGQISRLSDKEQESRREGGTGMEKYNGHYYIGRYYIPDGIDPIELKVEAPIEWIPLAVEGNQVEITV